MRYAVSLLISILYFTANSLGNHAFISGKVFDNETLEPLIGVHVLFGDGLGTITDHEGYFIFSTNTDRLEITFQYVGYKTLIKSVYPEPDDTIHLNIGLFPDIREIDEIVVSPGKTEQRISELTVSMNVIKPYMLSKNHIIEVEEIINQTPGIEVMDGQASIRGGSGWSYGAGSRVLVLVDGLPALAADAGNVKWQYLFLEHLSQIEIIKGASSVLYGSSALNGVINMRTADAVATPRTKFSITSGFYDKPNQKNWIWWDSPRIFTSASFSHMKKYGNTDIGIGTRLLYNNGYRRLNDEKLGVVNLKIKQHSKKADALKYGFFMNAGYNIKTDFLLWEDATYGALKQNDTSAMELNGTFLSLNPFVSFDKDKIRHDVRMRFQYSRNVLPENTNNNSDAISYYTEYQLFYKIIERLDMIFGASQQYNRIMSNLYDDHHGYNIAGFTQVDFRPVDRLKMVAGLRVEHNSLDGMQDKIIPIFRTGVNFEAGKYTFLRASYGQGYRYPSIAEKFASTTVGSVAIFPNPEIQSESGWSTELGIKQSLSVGKVSGQVDLSLFYSQNTDLIEYMFGIYPDPVTQQSGYGFRAVNIENSRVYGFELETLLNRYFGAFNTNLRGGYTFMYPVEFNKVTKKNTDTYLKFRRKHSLNVITSTAYKKFELGINLFIKSKILDIEDVFLNPLTRETILPGFYDYWLEKNVGHIVVDAYVAYRLGNKYKISFSCKNVTNTEYMGRPGDIMPQRHYSLQISGRL